MQISRARVARSARRFRVYLNLDLKRVTVIPRDDALGRADIAQLPKALFQALEYGAVTPSQRAKIEDNSVYFLAGPTAEARFLRSPDHVGASSDYEACADWATSLHPSETMCDAWVSDVAARADAFVEEHWCEIETVADALLEYQSLSAAEVRVLLAECISAATDGSPGTHD